jgi:hypothetical protein
MSWTQLESFSAWHNVEFATKNNGFGGLDARLAFNTPLHLRHIENLANMAKQGLFVYKGRGNASDATFVSGECAMTTASSSIYGDVKKNAKFAFGIGALPYYPDVPGAPQNTIIGGASLWVMAGKKPAEYKAHRLPARHQGGLHHHRGQRLLQGQPGHRCVREPDDPQDHRQVARRAPGQPPADPHHRRRGVRAGLGRQEDGQGRHRCRHQARQ